jgi:hypothetical protein
MQGRRKVTREGCNEEI